MRSTDVTKKTKSLLPCPFCGGVAAGPDPVLHNPRVKTVSCVECHAEGPARAKEADAVADWNRRAPRPE